MPSPETFHTIVYQDSAYPPKSDVLLLQTASGLYVLPEGQIDPRNDEAGFVDDICNATGYEVGPRQATFDASVVEYWPEAAEAYDIILPHQKATHFVLSRIVSGDLSIDSRYSGAEWTHIGRLPDAESIDPFSLVSLKRFQTAWALSNAY